MSASNEYTFQAVHGGLLLNDIEAELYKKSSSLFHFDIAGKKVYTFDSQGRYHSHSDQPAYRDHTGYKKWMTDGKTSRETGPAVIHANGAEEYWLGNRMFANRQAWEEALLVWKHLNLQEQALWASSGVLPKLSVSQTLEYKQSGVLTSFGGVHSSRSILNGSKCWHKNGKLHREDGPAVVDGSGRVEYWLEGVSFPVEHWNYIVGNGLRVSTDSAGYLCIKTQAGLLHSLYSAARGSEYYIHGVKVSSSDWAKYKRALANGWRISALNGTGFQTTNPSGFVDSFENLPARWTATDRYWYKNSVIHNEIGPAHMPTGGAARYYLNNKEISFAEFEMQSPGLKYDFGYGAVPAHKHANGGGWVANDAFVSPDTYVCPNSYIMSGCYIVGARIEASAIKKNCLIVNSQVKNCNFAEQSSVYDSKLYYCILQGKSDIKTSELNRLTIDSSKIQNAKLNDYKTAFKTTRDICLNSTADLIADLIANYGEATLKQCGIIKQPAPVKLEQVLEQTESKLPSLEIKPKEVSEPESSGAGTKVAVGALFFAAAVSALKAKSKQKAAVATKAVKVEEVVEHSR